VNPNQRSQRPDVPLIPRRRRPAPDLPCPLQPPLISAGANGTIAEDSFQTRSVIGRS
jgi:hypothetical protein